MKKTLLITLLCLGIFLPVFSQVADNYYLPQNVSYDAKIPTPKQFLGYQTGEWHVPYDQLLNYLRKVAELSDRFKMVEYGRTYENRPLYLLTVSSPKNLAAIEQIKEQHKQLSDPSLSDKLDTQQMPIVVWMGYSVHGNEASGTNAVPMVAYYLAAAQGAEIEALLNEAVILIDPRINPDGGERFANWVNANRSTNGLVTDPQSRELNEMWPYGRTNHYWFDLNRDWLYQQHPESKGRLAKFHEWKPNILTDHHEMGSGSSFFFQPGIASRVNPITPKKNQELTSKIGDFHAEALDNIKSLYFTKEGYDDFYYGKGSTYPDVNGCVGILFEQASSRGHAQETANGLLTFPFAIRNQVTTTLSTLKAAKNMRVEMLNWQREFYKEGNTDATKAYVFGGGNDPVKVWEMVNILRQNKIEVYELSKDETVEGKNFKKGMSYIVPLSQPMYRLAKGIFTKQTTFEDSLFYDISAWSMPLCFNVPAAEAKTPLALGKVLTENPFPKGKVIGKSNYSYVFEWDSYFAPRTAYELEKKGFRLKVATQPFTGVVDGSTRNFDYGTVEISLGINPQTTPEQLHALLQTLADRDGVDFYGVSTGLTPMGIDLGSSYFSNMRQPKALMLVGDGVDSNDAGEIWHLLDTRVGVPLSAASIQEVNGRVNLDRYNTLIMAGGNYGQLNEAKIKAWVQNGGTVVGMTGATEWLVEKGFSPTKIKKMTDSTNTPRPYGSIEKYRGAAQIPGTIFEATIDPTHPLFYGYKQTKLPLFKDNTIFLEKIKDPFNAPAIYTESPLLSGYATEKHKKMLKNTPAVIATSLGQGKVIVMTDNPNFRAFWYGTNKLFLNSLFFGGQILSGIRGGE